MTIHCIVEPLPEELQRIEDLVSSRPQYWQGLPLEWNASTLPDLVYLGSFETLDSAESRVFVIGRRYELDSVRVGGDDLGDGFFVEYLVVEKSQAETTVHRLLQQHSVTYASALERKDYVPAASVRDPVALSLGILPKWENKKEAIWPVTAAGPMHFVGQISIPENTVSRRYFAWGITAYLFAARSVGGATYKVVEQDQGAQTADEHYIQEALS